jgi:hypothetical protein
MHMPPKQNTIVINRGDSENRRDRKVCQLEKFRKLVDFLEDVKERNFTGYIKVNFTQGSIGRIEKFEEILKH